jgi:hypothetical protein
MTVEYRKGFRYPNLEDEPPADSLALFIEGIPVFKIWHAAPVKVEGSCLDGTCRHIGLGAALDCSRPHADVFISGWKLGSSLCARRWSPRKDKCGAGPMPIPMDSCLLKESAHG